MDRPLPPPSSSFNPHRLPSAGATRPAPRRSRPCPRFNPHRLPSAGATRHGLHGPSRPRTVSILTGCPQPVQRSTGPSSGSTERFQSSPAALSRCNPPLKSLQSDAPEKVSILTGCPQPVQRHTRAAAWLWGCFNPHRLPSAGATQQLCQLLELCLPVSILTGCPQPVQHAACDSISAWAWEFQSSPAALSRCNDDDVKLGEGQIRRVVSILTGCPQPVQTDAYSAFSTSKDMFQSSPAALSRCKPARTRPPHAGSGRACFNPHRLPSAGATTPPSSTNCKPGSRFNPHRLPSAGATCQCRAKSSAPS